MGHKTLGKWRIQKDQLCLDRGKDPGSGCYEVWLSGKKVELRDRTRVSPWKACCRSRRTDEPDHIPLSDGAMGVR